ncbi:unnamed protein product [Orchesella dallaii]|uniref:Ionotropic glutamate receptor C-terminal domain-containing protein n=1 Tax=Orchesella dallaii TaxID=48710 RepID=A0ABP1S2P1_9HEXA
MVSCGTGLIVNLIYFNYRMISEIDFVKALDPHRPIKPTCNAIPMYITLELLQIANTTISPSRSRPKALQKYGNSSQFHVIVEPLMLQHVTAALSRHDASYDGRNKFLVTQFSNSSSNTIANQYYSYTKSKDYPGFVTQLVFVRHNQIGVLKYLNLCYICNKDDFLKWSPHFLNSDSESRTNKQRLENGFGMKMSLFTYLKYIPNVNNCEFLILNFKPTECNRAHAMLSIFAKTFNISLVSEVNTESFMQFQNIEGPLTFQVCISCGFQPLTKLQVTPILPVLFHVDVSYIFYCEDTVQFSTSNFAIFINTIDMGVWSLLICCALVFWILNKNYLSGCSIFIMMIYPGFRLEKWLTHHRLFICLCPIMFVSIWYNAFVTSDVVAPIPPNIMQSFKEFFQRGYKFIVRSEDHIQYQMHLYGSYLRKLGVNLSPENFIIHPDLARNLTTFCDCDTLKLVSKLKGTVDIWGTDAKGMLKRNIFGEHTTVGFVCYIVPEKLQTFFSFFYFKGLYLDKVADLFGDLASSGILRLFEEIDVGKVIYTAEFHKPSGCKRDVSGFQKVSLNSPIITGFYALGGGVLVTVVLLIVEMVFPKFMFFMEKIKANRPNNSREYLGYLD